MGVAATVARFLDQKRVDYRVMTHTHTDSSSETAEAAHVSGECVAKGVVLKRRDEFFLAVLPATHVLQLEVLGRQLGCRLSLAEEDDLPQLFPDCEVGAVPVVGKAYGLQTVVDETLLERPEVCFEAGEHCELVCVSTHHFEKLMDGARYNTFSKHCG